MEEDLEFMESSEKELPSQVTDKVWLWCFSTQSAPYDSSLVGKWMLFCNNVQKDSEGLTELDRTWLLVRQIVKKGKLYRAKCSTAFSKEQMSRTGVVICYTTNFQDKVDVEKSAESIREHIVYPCDMFYKTDDATLSGLYRNKGNKAVSIYKYTKKGEFFERSQDHLRWKTVEMKS